MDWRGKANCRWAFGLPVPDLRPHFSSPSLNHGAASHGWLGPAKQHAHGLAHTAPPPPSPCARDWALLSRERVPCGLGLVAAVRPQRSTRSSEGAAQLGFGSGLALSATAGEARAGSATGQCLRGLTHAERLAERLERFACLSASASASFSCTRTSVGQAPSYRIVHSTTTTTATTTTTTTAWRPAGGARPLSTAHRPPARPRQRHGGEGTQTRHKKKLLACPKQWETHPRRAWVPIAACMHT
ncbi:hypothetical protein COCC4DRAFT_136634 [Bipolaris maydis ATCC 48331]|uniref:Uncharacterized protein n=2 Tax=Cochliobolus heterostrophus TaxID=5016 RepID=M2USM9_COCH5|nr:uncharacterized protein COCC4DRAFT_136634 [Bipolaris maydis ATCC 48331]EMD90852.1 hypothetical protein COCHEDRAFT_1030630 [Bipolaris maydis C5]ENI06062.1 hypothetical protein COCC4DRAFT_136634 [Bipolaris maydis ATCC 48331]KAJ6205345.1 hypothetical protein PSV09DRAFT_1030630 [Bipolaris maydis]